jgi:C-terminal processing protease CtpA/Prc
MMRRALLILLWLLLLAPASHGGNSSREFGGVGIDGVPLEDGRIKVRQLVAGGPAHLAGIQVGDIITGVDGKPTKGSDFTQVIDRRLRGRAGTKVLITLVRPGEEKPRHFTLTRRQMVLPRQ